jgi:ATP-dependent Clp protease ATP-binding subunit ClpB
MFTPLNKSEIEQIVCLQVADISKRLAENGVELVVTDGAIEALAEAGFDPQFGARPIKRAIQRYLLNDLSKQILAGNVTKDATIKVESEGEGLEFRNLSEGKE